jgi:hypothetical protein
MKTIDLLSIGLRLFGCYLIYSCLYMVFLLPMYLQQDETGVNSHAPIYLPMVINFLLGILLFKFPVTISKWLLPKNTGMDDEISITAKNLQACLICILGIYILSMYIPEVVKAIYQAHELKEMNNSSIFSEFMNASLFLIVHLIIGIFLSLFGGKVSNFLYKLND